MKRRTVIGGLAATGVIVGLGGLGLRRGGVDASALTINATLRDLERMTEQGMTGDGAWSAAQVLSHCAQSVEFSMDGFPTMKSALFQSTAGAAAFAIFVRRGRMGHALDEPIPGAPALSLEVEIPAAAQRLRAALTRFDQHQGALAPHFAYGSLTKDEYAVAHALHWRNHLDELRVVT
ncbi:MAG: DUF1569 domain-containing protein [Gammaproteobacteria bacterium]